MRYNFDHPKPEYFNNEVWRKSLLEVISGLEDRLKSQHTLDNIITYSKFCGAVFSEMNNYLDVKVITNKTHKYFKNNKPYWDYELTHSWKAMAHAGQVSKCEYKRSVRNCLHSKFIEAGKLFDKLLCQKERQYNRNYIYILKKLNASNHKEFWNKITKFGQ